MHDNTGKPKPASGHIAIEVPTCRISSRSELGKWLTRRQAMRAETAIDFLENLRPAPWVLTAIVPDGSTTTITAKTADDVRAFVAKHNGTRNLYYSTNPTRETMTKKASKTDIAAIEYLLSDLDPRDDETSEAAKVRYLAALDVMKPPPTAIIDSGNGIQVLWRLAEPIELAEPIWETNEKGESEKKFSTEAQRVVHDVENRVKLLMESLGGKAGTQNIDRILRLPGAINLPNEKKLRDGRTKCETKLIRFTGATCSLDDFPTAAASGSDNTSNTKQQSTSIDWDKVEQQAGWLKGVDVLEKDFNLKGQMIIVHGGNLGDLNFDLEHANLLVKPYQSWSEVSFALAAIFKNDGRYSTEQIAAALMCDLECNQHVTKLKDQNTKRRAVERLIIRSHDQTKQQHMKHAPGTPDWRERRINGAPIPSMHNARLAITALGIDCSYDTFHNLMLFGYKDDKTRHVVEFILGEVTDNSTIALRQLLSDHFGFDLTDKHVRDAVVSLAMEHRFDPIADILDEAQANWDGVARLDRVAVDYFNCADTPLNSAIIRKMMIAAVARVRSPGCKFDNIVVLESEEGYNKSTAWMILALSKENFSDERIIGKENREVQEQLSAVWIHENADLAGMRKAEVEQVKAFASRMIDIARPAFGHFLKKQKRHSIEVGSTNSDEYLQSQTGNRRFWPLKVLKAIDIDKLLRDVMQLWGEAAYYEAEGESLVLDESLWPAAAIEQEARRVRDPWEDLLAEIPEEVEVRYWENGEIETKTVKIIHRFAMTNTIVEERVASSELLTHVLNVPIAQQETRHGMKLSNVMKQLGWERPHNGNVTIETKRRKGYYRRVRLPPKLHTDGTTLDD